MIVLRLTPRLPLKDSESPSIDSPISSLLVGFLPPVKTSLQMKPESPDSEPVSSLHEMGYSSSSTASLAQTIRLKKLIMTLSYSNHITLNPNLPLTPTVGFFILLNYDAMSAANIGIFLFH